MRKFDLIIFGATGFTCRYVVERLVQTLQKTRLPTKWAIAVRNPAKMKTYLKQMKTTTGVTDLENKIPVLAADVNDYTSMKKVFANGTLVMSCIGLYSLYGEPVVRACIDSKANYMDLSGEPLFMEKMALQHDKAARENEVFVVSSCGFDSIPSDVGTQYLKSQFKPGHLATVEHYLETSFHSSNKYDTFSAPARWRSMANNFFKQGRPASTLN